MGSGCKLYSDKGRDGQGHGIFASGSPFKKVTLADGCTFHPGQGNNACVILGVALGIITCGVRHISDNIFLTAQAVADMVTEEHLAEGRLYPPLGSIREVSFKIAMKIVDYAYEHGIAAWYPEPKDKEAFVLSHVYNSDYDSFTLDSYTWPKEAMKVQDVQLLLHPPPPPLVSSSLREIHKTPPCLAHLLLI
ncbi:NADP-dependent malic enzyme, mitochondrial-like [Electrophorus electricus]|uniref:NADP-dependent malic enzyme, mitochondrial-like n=1 Tax=Electrophorus electricus TaxID=8005 RepID=UPI0015D0AB48|nr:NADP-dependent malic enzyme, mitochondrial-like [Electrophorus electricus]XP_035378831.1 NADP-dependent malic enzyme, mitochondrial-like [Electrophorus electricus]